MRPCGTIDSGSSREGSPRRFRRALRPGSNAAGSKPLTAPEGVGSWGTPRVSATIQALRSMPSRRMRSGRKSCATGSTASRSIVAIGPDTTLHMTRSMNACRCSSSMSGRPARSVSSARTGPRREDGLKSLMALVTRTSSRSKTGTRAGVVTTSTSWPAAARDRARGSCARPWEGLASVVNITRNAGAFLWEGSRTGEIRREVRRERGRGGQRAIAGVRPMPSQLSPARRSRSGSRRLRKS